MSPPAPPAYAPPSPPPPPPKDFNIQGLRDQINENFNYVHSNSISQKNRILVRKASEGSYSATIVDNWDSRKLLDVGGAVSVTAALEKLLDVTCERVDEKIRRKVLEGKKVFR